MKRRLTARNATRRGLTLIEVVIVLGVVSFIFAALWAAADAVHAKQAIDESASIVGGIANASRNIYAGQPRAVPPATIPTQIAANLFPGSIVMDANTTRNAWGGLVRINYDTKAVSGVNSLVGFSVEFTIPGTVPADDRRDICLSMATRMAAHATNYAGGLAGALPSALLPINATQGEGPDLALLNLAGGWTNATGRNDLLTLLGATDCNGFAFYYRL